MVILQNSENDISQQILGFLNTGIFWVTGYLMYGIIISSYGTRSTTYSSMFKYVAEFYLTTIWKWGSFLSDLHRYAFFFY